MEEESTYDIINKKYNEQKKKKSPLDKEIDNIKEQIEKTYDKYKFAKTRKVTKLNGDLFHDSGAVIIPGVYDALQKDIQDMDPSLPKLLDQIKLDIDRAGWDFLYDPVTKKKNESWYETGKEMLKNILSAICVYYSKIKLTDQCYLQGMNFIGVRVLYLHSFDKNTGFNKDKEEECFWILNILFNSTKSCINSFLNMGYSFRVPTIKLGTLFTIILNKYVTFSYNFLIGTEDDDVWDPLTYRFLQSTSMGLQAMGGVNLPLNPLIGWDGPYKNESIIHGWTSSIHLQMSWIIYILQSSEWKEFIKICKHISTVSSSGAKFSSILHDQKYIKWFLNWKGDHVSMPKMLTQIKQKVFDQLEAYDKASINDMGPAFLFVVEFFQQNILYDKILDVDEFKKIYSEVSTDFSKQKMLDLVEEIENVFLIAWKNRGDPKLRKNIIKKYEEKWGHLVNTLYIDSWISVVGAIEKESVDRGYDIDNEITLYTQHNQYEKNMDKIMELFDKKEKVEKEEEEEMTKLENENPAKWAAKKGLVKYTPSNFKKPIFVYKNSMASQSPYSQMERRLLPKYDDDPFGPQKSIPDEFSIPEVIKPAIVNTAAIGTTLSAFWWPPLIPFIIAGTSFGIDTINTDEEKGFTASILRYNLRITAAIKKIKTSTDHKERKAAFKELRRIMKKKKDAIKSGKSLKIDIIKRAEEELEEQLALIDSLEKELGVERFNPFSALENKRMIKTLCDQWFKKYLKKNKGNKKDKFKQLKESGWKFRTDWEGNGRNKQFDNEFDNICSGRTHRLNYQRFLQFEKIDTDNIELKSFEKVVSILDNDDGVTRFPEKRVIQVSIIIEQVLNAFIGMQFNESTKDFKHFFFYKDYFDKIIPYLHVISDGVIVNTFILFCRFVSKNINFFDLNWTPIGYERAYGTIFYNSSKPYFLDSGIQHIDKRTFLEKEIYKMELIKKKLGLKEEELYEETEKINRIYVKFEKGQYIGYENFLEMDEQLQQLFDDKHRDKLLEYEIINKPFDYIGFVPDKEGIEKKKAKKQRYLEFWKKQIEDLNGSFITDLFEICTSIDGLPQKFKNKKKLKKIIQDSVSILTSTPTTWMLDFPNMCELIYQPSISPEFNKYLLNIVLFTDKMDNNGKTTTTATKLFKFLFYYSIIFFIYYDDIEEDNEDNRKLKVWFEEDLCYDYIFNNVIQKKLKDEMNKNKDLGFKDIHLSNDNKFNKLKSKILFKILLKIIGKITDTTTPNFEVNNTVDPDIQLNLSNGQVIGQINTLKCKSKILKKKTFMEIMERKTKQINSIYIATHEYPLPNQPIDELQLVFKEGDHIIIHDIIDAGEQGVVLRGELGDKIGVFPVEYVTKIKDIVWGDDGKTEKKKIELFEDYTSKTNAIEKDLFEERNTKTRMTKNDIKYLLVKKNALLDIQVETGETKEAETNDEVPKGTVDLWLDKVFKNYPNNGKTKIEELKEKYRDNVQEYRDRVITIYKGTSEQYNPEDTLSIIDHDDIDRDLSRANLDTEARTVMWNIFREIYKIVPSLTDMHVKSLIQFGQNPLVIVTPRAGSNHKDKILGDEGTVLEITQNGNYIIQYKNKDDGQHVTDTFQKTEVQTALYRQQDGRVIHALMAITTDDDKDGAAIYALYIGFMLKRIDCVDENYEFYNFLPPMMDGLVPNFVERSQVMNIAYKILFLFSKDLTQHLYKREIRFIFFTSLIGFFESISTNVNSYRLLNEIMINGQKGFILIIVSLLLANKSKILSMTREDVAVWLLNNMEFLKKKSEVSKIMDMLVKIKPIIDDVFISFIKDKKDILFIKDKKEILFNYKTGSWIDETPFLINDNLENELEAKYEKVKNDLKVDLVIEGKDGVHPLSDFFNMEQSVATTTPMVPDRYGGGKKKFRKTRKNNKKSFFKTTLKNKSSRTLE